jgi:hypothetical protein
MILDARSRDLQMCKTDYGLARRVLPDLATNAWKAAAQRVEIAVRHENPQRDGSGSDPGPPTRPWVADGLGRRRRAGDAGPACGAGTSLRILDEHPHRFDGTVVAEQRGGGDMRSWPQWEIVTMMIPGNPDVISVTDWEGQYWEQLMGVADALVGPGFLRGAALAASPAGRAP